MTKLWTTFTALVVVLAAGFCAKVQCDSDRKIEALRSYVESVKALDAKPVVSNSPPMWWCTAPMLGPSVNRELSAECYFSRHECEISAGIIGSTCMASDAPFCFDVSRDAKPAAVVCCFDLQTCQSRRKRHAFARSDCYRATAGFAAELARKTDPISP
jgi:hypothetical protein